MICKDMRCGKEIINGKIFHCVGHEDYGFQTWRNKLVPYEICLCEDCLNRGWTPEGKVIAIIKDGQIEKVG